MAFVFRQVPADDMEKLLGGLVGDRLGWRKRMAPSHWAIDEDSGNFLYKTYWGDEEDRTRSAYVFSWRGEFIPISIDTEESFLDGTTVVSRTELSVLPFMLSGQSEQFREDVQDEIAAALKCRNPALGNVIVKFVAQDQPRR